MINYKILKHSDNEMPTWDGFLGPILQVADKKEIWKRQELIKSTLNEIELPHELADLRYPSKYHDLVAPDRINRALSEFKNFRLINFTTTWILSNLKFRKTYT